MHDPFGQTNPELNPDLTGDHGKRTASEMVSRLAWMIGGLIVLLVLFWIATSAL